MIWKKKLTTFSKKVIEKIDSIDKEINNFRTREIKSIGETGKQKQDQEHKSVETNLT